jgi:hypothetical protein
VREVAYTERKGMANVLKKVNNLSSSGGSADMCGGNLWAF